MIKVTNKIVTDYNEVGIDKMSITYCQNPDCVSGEDEYQYLTIETRNGGTEPEDTFINIKTGEGGWSLGSTDDINVIAEDFMGRFNKKK